MDYSPPGSSICGILQARILEWKWVALPFSRGSSWPRSQAPVSRITIRATRETHSVYLSIPASQFIFPSHPTFPQITIKKHAAAAAKSLQSCPTLCNAIDGSPLGSSVPGILQARILEWVAISFSKVWKWKVKVKSESEVAQSCPTLSNPVDCSLGSGLPLPSPEGMNKYI